MKSRFLNVDLELISRRKLDALVKELGERVFVLYKGIPPGKRKGHFVSMEGAGLYNSRSPDRVIHALCGLVEGMSPTSRRLWDEADKIFDIGYEMRKDKRIEATLRPATIRRIAALGATVAFTCYRGDA